MDLQPVVKLKSAMKLDFYFSDIHFETFYTSLNIVGLNIISFVGEIT